MSNEEKKSWLRNFFELGEVGGYFFRKKDPNRPRNTNIKAMHIINRIAILMFLVCLLIILKRYIFGY
ncbi:MAG TPA: DUF6728 family protein [Cyclobacteriaceae bacterium]|nr:DUF6728 family protein [Cyclobacteriaceae bacterium]